MRKQMLGSVLVALFLLVGCKPVTTFGGVPRAKVYRTIISLSPSTTELMSLTGIGLKGRTKACNFPPSYSSIEVVADLKPNYEKIATIKPDLILLDGDLYGAQEIEKLKQTGATVKIFDATNLEDHIKELYELGELVSGEVNINEYIIKLRKNIQASIGEAPPKKVTAVMVIPDASGHHMIAGTKSFQADEVRVSGATLVGPDSSKFEMLNPEWLLSQNPDWIIVAGEIKGINSDPRFSNLAAIKNKKIFGINQDICLRRGVRADKFIYGAHKIIMIGEGKPQ